MKDCIPGCHKTGEHDTCGRFIGNNVGEIIHVAKRDNVEKAQLSLIPTKAQVSEAKVWMFGAKKYGRDNWQKGLPFLSVIDSLLRHALAYKEGETHDSDTGESHMAHVRCNAAMLIEFESTHPELDDRKK